MLAFINLVSRQAVFGRKEEAQLGSTIFLSVSIDDSQRWIDIADYRLYSS